MVCFLYLYLAICTVSLFDLLVLNVQIDLVVPRIINWTLGFVCILELQLPMLDFKKELMLKKEI